MFYIDRRERELQSVYTYVAGRLKEARRKERPKEDGKSREDFGVRGDESNVLILRVDDLC